MARSTETFGPLAPPEAPATLEPGRTLAGRYTIESLLGSGGSSMVYRAYDAELDCPVALKILRADRVSEASLARLRREASLARDVSSPHLVPIYDLGRDGDLVFLAMQPIAGETLRQRLRHGPLPIEPAVEIARQVLSGLEALHFAGIVHRDVKPGNVLLAETGGAKLADLGLARPILRRDGDITITESQFMVGTFDYLAPEQVLGGELTPATDLYALGLVLFEMLTGERPFKGDSPMAAIVARVQSDTPDVADHRPDVPADIREALLTLLAREPAQRSAEALSRGPDPFRRQPAQAAKPESSRRISWRWLIPATIVLASLLAFAFLRSAFRPPLRDLELDPATGGTIARGDGGKVIWQRPEPHTTWVRFQPHPSTTPQLVGVKREDPTSHASLVFVDPASGRSLDSAELPSAHERSFEPLGFADHYGTAIRVLETPQGGSWILVSFAHSVQWPSYTVLLDPASGTKQVLFVASGHHNPVAILDTDGDGSNEVLFVGINNRMGWNTAITAIRPTPVPPGSSIAHPGTAAYGPGDVFEPQANLGLLWYCLLPPDAIPSAQQTRIDHDERIIRVARLDGSTYDIGFHGFRADLGPIADAAQARTDRRAVYHALRTAFFHTHGGTWETAAESALEAAERAATIPDPSLLEWTQRALATAWIRVGDFDAGDAMFRQLTATSPWAADIGFDAGDTFHLEGELERAIAWYRMVFGRGGNDAQGRAEYESALGLATALGELGDWDEAAAAIEQYLRATSPGPAFQGILTGWLHWRQGRPLPLEAVPEAPPRAPDQLRYLALEVRLHAGGDRHRVLALAEAETLIMSEECRTLLELLILDLGAELLDADRLLIRAERALHRLWWDAERFPLARAHLDVGVARFAGIARRIGRPELAEAAAERYRRWRSEQSLPRMPATWGSESP